MQPSNTDHPTDAMKAPGVIDHPKGTNPDHPTDAMKVPGVIDHPKGTNTDHPTAGKRPRAKPSPSISGTAHAFTYDCDHSSPRVCTSVLFIHNSLYNIQ